MFNERYFFLFIFFLCLFQESSSKLLLTINSENYLDYNHQIIKIIQFCKSCPSPELEGSIAYGLGSRYGVKVYSITAELVYCVPNYAEVKKLRNKRQLKDKIGFVQRGEVTFYDKVMNAQACGVVALIIMDDGQCDDNFLSCGKRIGGVNEGGFGAFDQNDMWVKVTIPVLLVTKQTGQKLQRMMNLAKEHSEEWGEQYYTKETDENEL